MPEYSIAYVKFFINAAARVMNMHTGQIYGMRGGINFSRLLANFPRKISKKNIRNNCCHEKHGLFTNGYPYRFLSLEFHLIFSLADRSLFWTMRLVIFLQSSVSIRQESWILGLRLLMNT